MRRVAYTILFVLAGIMMPVLIWVALSVAVRKPLLRVLKRVLYAALFFLVGILMPILIWAGFVITVGKLFYRGIPRFVPLWVQRRASLQSPVKYLVVGPLVLLTVTLMPILIWVALVIAVRELQLRWRESRLASSMTCRADLDCPAGYICLGGRCMPQY